MSGDPHFSCGQPKVRCFMPTVKCVQTNGFAFPNFLDAKQSASTIPSEILSQSKRLRVFNVGRVHCTETKKMLAVLIAVFPVLKHLLSKCSNSFDTQNKKLRLPFNQDLFVDNAGNCWFCGHATDPGKTRRSFFLLSQKHSV